MVGGIPAVYSRSEAVSCSSEGPADSIFYLQSGRAKTHCRFGKRYNSAAELLGDFGRLKVNACIMIELLVVARSSWSTGMPR
jgi:hypothetical protein